LLNVGTISVLFTVVHWLQQLRFYYRALISPDRGGGTAGGVSSHLAARRQAGCGWLTTALGGRARERE